MNFDYRDLISENEVLKNCNSVTEKYLPLFYFDHFDHLFFPSLSAFKNVQAQVPSVFSLFTQLYLVMFKKDKKNTGRE